MWIVRRRKVADAMRAQRPVQSIHTLGEGVAFVQ
jgi:hypothetical protein